MFKKLLFFLCLLYMVFQANVSMADYFKTKVVTFEEQMTQYFNPDGDLTYDIDKPVKGYFQFDVEPDSFIIYPEGWSTTLYGDSRIISSYLIDSVPEEIRPDPYHFVKRGADGEPVEWGHSQMDEYSVTSGYLFNFGHLYEGIDPSDGFEFNIYNIINDTGEDPPDLPYIDGNLEIITTENIVHYLKTQIDNKKIFISTVGIVVSQITRFSPYPLVKYN